MPETTKKKTTEKKGTRGKGGRSGNSSPRKKVVLPEPEFIHSEVVIMMSFAAAAILFLSNFGLCGVVGQFLRSVQLGIFGGIGYIAPVLLLLGLPFTYRIREIQERHLSWRPLYWRWFLCVVFYSFYLEPSLVRGPLSLIFIWSPL